jgi:Skp family chaperone for outer membrane proteins
MRVLVLFFLSALCLTANAQSLKIGFIDTEQVIANLTQYKNSVDKYHANLSLKNKSY